MTGTQRYNKWLLRFNDPESQATSPAMTRLMANASVKQLVESEFNNLYSMENGVRQILDTAGVDTLLVPAYLNFGRRLYKLVKRYTGETARNECAVFIAYYVAKGLSQSVLELVRDYFNITAPTP
ncbi:MAG: hypothetical protein FJ276_23095 [Planctomycetes bacterium]|nr:hypothetical protein [Planctomycetota bacterium]